MTYPTVRPFRHHRSCRRQHRPSRKNRLATCIGSDHAAGNREPIRSRYRPHDWIDRLPAPPGNSRPSCRRLHRLRAVRLTSAIRSTSCSGQDHTEAQRIALVQQLGLDQPFFVQYGRFLWIALHGDFGISYRLAQPVGQLDRRAAAGDAGTGDHGVGAGVRDRRADGRLYRHPPRPACCRACS